MADLSITVAGIRSPNPFWLASGPPTNTGDQVARAFDAGWGGCVWKTLGDPIVNVSSRFGSIARIYRVTYVTTILSMAEEKRPSKKNQYRLCLICSERATAHSPPQVNSRKACRERVRFAGKTGRGII